MCQYCDRKRSKKKFCRYIQVTKKKESSREQVTASSKKKKKRLFFCSIFRLFAGRRKDLIFLISSLALKHVNIDNGVYFAIF